CHSRDPLPPDPRLPQPATETLEIAELDANRHIEIQGALAKMSARLNYDLTETARLLVVGAPTGSADVDLPDPR
ncbi:MAG: hypothetical protein OEV40_20945, partial [Acidimicrobiia bacterium]|nr:hypothetical protein [Acidimicrobiia bacterium]